MTKLITYCKDTGNYYILCEKEKGWDYSGESPINPNDLVIMPDLEKTLEVLFDGELSKLGAVLKGNEALGKKAVEYGEENNAEYAALGRFRKRKLPEIKRKENKYIVRQNVILFGRD